MKENFNRIFVTEVLSNNFDQYPSVVVILKIFNQLFSVSLLKFQQFFDGSLSSSGNDICLFVIWKLLLFIFTI